MLPGYTHRSVILHSLTLGASAWVVMVALEFVSTGQLHLRETYVWVSLGIALVAWFQTTRRNQARDETRSPPSQAESRSR